MDISTEKSRLNLKLVHRYLAQESTWAMGIPYALVEKSVQHSLCFGGYEDGEQIAFARVVSDFATFAYLMDVFVLKEHRGQGYSLQLMDTIMAHPELQGLRRFMLATSTARELYLRYGFNSPAKPEILMEISKTDLYNR